MEIEKGEKNEVTSRELSIASRIAAFLPANIRQLLSKGQSLPLAGQSLNLQTAVLFCDISGFTRLAEELATDGPRGAEELNQVLLRIFTPMINLIHENGGAISHFHGDAMMAFFPDNDGAAARRALACGQRMQRLMETNLHRVVTNRPPAKNQLFNLNMRVGVGYGPALAMVVGEPGQSMEFVLGGPAIDESTQAADQAGRGDIVASQAALLQASLPCQIAYRLVTESIPSEETKPERKLPDAGLEKPRDLADWASSFMHPALARRLRSDSQPYLAEHRPVTSLFVQFEGIDFLSESAGDLLQSYYKWARQIVMRYGSRNSHLNRVLTGDKGCQLHILFGAPVAPDAPEQAIRCALALQREKPSLISQQRIGLAAGKVFACPVGSEQRREYTVVGDVVNLSARLMQACPDGAVLVDKSTVDRCQQYFEFKELPRLSLKGKRAPMATFQVLGEKTTSSLGKMRFDYQTSPFVGRQVELGVLRDRMDDALKGMGSAIVVSGATGVGKSRMLAAGATYWLDSGGKVLTGECYPHTTETPFGPWLHIWRDLFGLKDDMLPEVQFEKVAQKTELLCPECFRDVDLWRAVLGLPSPSGTVVEQITAEARQERFFRMVRRVLAAIAHSQPLAVVLEDIQWADQSSLDLIDAIAANLTGMSHFLSFSIQDPAEIELAIFDQPFCVSLALSDLPVAEGRRIVNHLTGVKMLPALVEQHLGLRDREGRDSPVNPLFLEEALRVMLETGVLEIGKDVNVNEERLAKMQVPDTIHGLLLARLDRLSTASRDVLQVASVIGRQFGLELLSVIDPGRSREDIIALLRELSSIEFTRLVASSPEITYLFQHAMTRQVAYESLPFARRGALHAAVADWLVEKHNNNLRPHYSTLAYHYHRTNLHDKGLTYAQAAADDARSLFANSEAVELYGMAVTHLQALGEEENWEVAANLYLARGDVLRLLGDFQAAMVNGERALDIVKKGNSPAIEAKTLNLLADIKYRQANYKEVKILAQKVASSPISDIPAGELARAQIWLGMAESSQANYQQALNHLQQAEAICQQTGNQQQLGRVLEATAFVYYSQQQLEPALKAMRRAVRLFRIISTPLHVAYSLNNVAQIYYSLGKPLEAIGNLGEVIKLARDTSRNLLAVALYNRAEILAYTGQYAASLTDFKEALDLLTIMNDELGLVTLHILWGYELSLVLRDLSQAEEHFRVAGLIIEKNPEQYRELHIQWLIGQLQLALERQNLQDASDYCRDLDKLIIKDEFLWWQPAAYHLCGRLVVELGRREEAVSRWHAGVVAVDNGGCPDYLPLLLLGLGQAAKDRTGQADMMLRTVESARSRARHLDRIYCLSIAGRIMIRNHENRLKEFGEICLAEAQLLTRQTLRP